MVAMNNALLWEQTSLSEERGQRLHNATFLQFAILQFSLKSLHHEVFDVFFCAGVFESFLSFPHLYNAVSAHTQTAHSTHGRDKNHAAHQWSPGTGATRWPRWEITQVAGGRILGQAQGWVGPAGRPSGWTLWVDPGVGPGVVPGVDPSVDILGGPWS